MLHHYKIYNDTFVNTDMQWKYCSSAIEMYLSLLNKQELSFTLAVLLLVLFDGPIFLIHFRIVEIVIYLPVSFVFIIGQWYINQL